MKFLPQVIFSLLLLNHSLGALPPGYKGKPFKDPTHQKGPQMIPGIVQCALYDWGGEGIAYHDVETVNLGSQLNHTSFERNGAPIPHCSPGVPQSICFFRENEGVDISYVKDFADLNHPNLVDPLKQQLYIGWEEDGEWTNYTVKVRKSGTYRIIALYSHQPNTITFDVDGKPASSGKLPTETGDWHTWNKAEIGEITFPQKGLHLLTLHYNKGNNLAYFEFVPKK
jgi:hypothetical protein